MQVSQSGSGPINCSEAVTITARLTNPSSDLEATGTQLTLEPGSGLAIISGSATQPVSGGTLTIDETSEQISWTVRPTSSGNHAITVRGDGTAFGTTFTNREQLAPISADCTPPRVEPTGLTVSPSAEVECGQIQTVTTSFQNPTITDAAGASAELALPAGTELVSGPMTQAVAGGLLAKGQTSSAHHWQLRLPSPVPGGTSTATATIIGRTTSSSADSPASTTLRCARAADPPPAQKGTVELVDGKLAFKERAKKLVASGRLAGSAAVSVDGEVTVEFKRFERRRGATLTPKQADLHGNGKFKATLRTCRKADFKPFVEYPGSDAYKSLSRRPLAGRLSVKGC